MLGIILLATISLFSLSILYTTLRTGISPMPSSAQVRHVILEISEQASDEGVVIDFGSGWGGLLFALARKYPERQIIGYELSWLPWIYSQICKTIFRLHNLSFYRQDFVHADLPAANLLICYLHPKGMQRLQKKLEQQQTRALLISNTFALPDNQPIETIRLNDLYNTPIYIYRLNNSF